VRASGSPYHPVKVVLDVGCRIASEQDLGDSARKRLLSVRLRTVEMPNEYAFHDSPSLVWIVFGPSEMYIHLLLESPFRGVSAFNTGVECDLHDGHLQTAWPSWDSLRIAMFCPTLR